MSQGHHEGYLKKGSASHEGLITRLTVWHHKGMGSISSHRYSRFNKVRGEKFRSGLFINIGDLAGARPVDGSGI